MKRISKILFMFFGLTFLGIGAVGVIVPLLPTTPFLLLSAFFMLRSSEKVQDWFLNTDIYRKRIQPFKDNKAMTMKSKIRVIVTVTVLLALCFYLARDILVAKIIIGFIWIIHILYFFLILKTIPEDN